jgi:sugar lactone lactonase YvrE
MKINNNTKWIQNGITIAGGNGQGNQLNQLSNPFGIYIDDDNQSIYIADYSNDRIIEWKYNANNGQIIVGQNGEGDRSDQLKNPSNLLVDKKNNSIIICDKENRRVVRWPLRNGTNGEIIIFNINCYGLTLDKDGDLYVSDCEKNEVRRWKIGDKIGTLVAGGNGQGARLNQLSYPTNIFVDQDYSVYVSDMENHRVIKWMKGAKEGIVVAGGNDEGNNLKQLCNPSGVTVDPLGNVYVADPGDHRIMRWLKGSKEGSIIVGGNGQGEQPNQFACPSSLSFDRHGNLYVVDLNNHRIQKFPMDSK